MEIEDAVKFHGHMCPGLAIGFRVAKIAEENFGTRSKDEELVAIVENKSCSVDAIQVINSCTFGKGNLVFRDYGKHVYTFFKRGDEKALRISRKQDVFERGGGNDLFQKVRAGTATPEEKAEFQREREEKIKMILEAPADELFKIEEIEAEPPQKAVIFQTLTCSECGEGMMESRARVAHGKYFCLPCFEKYDV
ncbi:formylmethanofuran dehydrogenase subunit E [Methanohalophilus levihalophilus]|uniref:FmdE family protein n=1 Tax=Methanohalophilus levihalophilus TaxID=1431282 RepID=UPI001AE2C100|nr:FmdE family protein [Methanohalophilus levihalophilus]MBP2030538.1 formylmethanofuran dehydrogenase subunit E [Methanohalophilus levihalophilus]